MNRFIHTAESHSFTGCDLNLLIRHQKKTQSILLLYFGHTGWAKMSILKLWGLFFQAVLTHSLYWACFPCCPKEWCRHCSCYLAWSDPYNRESTKSSWKSHQLFTKSLWSAKQITQKPLLKRTITPSLITESTTASSDRGENCSVESNVLLCLALPESFPRAKASAVPGEIKSHFQKWLEFFRATDF